MTSNEFTLWLKGYLEALETEGVESCKIERILLKMKEINNGRNQERIVYGPNVNRTTSTQQGYVNPDTNRPIV
tara:strand:- start:201 stop:419 length:219 start_codon:yes stop_codon:yes gene_type:complete